MTSVAFSMDKIRTLPAERPGEVEAFVNILTAKARRASALLGLLAVAPALEAAGAPGTSEEEIQAEVDSVRAERTTGERE